MRTTVTHELHQPWLHVGINQGALKSIAAWVSPAEVLCKMVWVQFSLRSLKSSPGKVVKLETNRGYCSHPSTEPDDEHAGGERITKMNQVSFHSQDSHCLRKHRKLKVDQEDSRGRPVVKNPPANARDVGLIPKIRWTEEPGELQSMGSQRVEHDLASEHTCTHSEASTCRGAAELVCRNY